MTPVVSNRPSWLTRERLVVAGLLLLTAVVRGGVLWGMQGNLEQDPDAYREIGENILEHGIYGLGSEGKPTPTAYRPPLYPIVLSNLPAADGKHVALWKVAVLHVLLAVATVWLTYLTAKRVLGRVGQASETSADPRGAGLESATSTPRGSALAGASLTHPTIAALLVACDPILLNQQTLVMTETLATFLAILALWCLVRFTAHRSWWNAALAGGAIALAALVRPTFLPWLGLVGLVVIADCGLRIGGSGLGVRCRTLSVWLLQPRLSCRPGRFGISRSSASRS